MPARKEGAWTSRRMLSPSRAQLEQMRRALPAGALPHEGGPGNDGPQIPGEHSGGMYL